MRREDRGGGGMKEDQRGGGAEMQPRWTCDTWEKLALFA